MNRFYFLLFYTTAQGHRYVFFRGIMEFFDRTGGEGMDF